MIRDLARRALSPHDGELRFDYLDGLPWADLLTRLAAIPGGTVVFMLTYDQDALGNEYARCSTSPQTARMIATCRPSTLPPSALSTLNPRVVSGTALAAGSGCHRRLAPCRSPIATPTFRLDGALARFRCRRKRAAVAKCADYPGFVDLVAAAGLPTRPTDGKAAH